MKLCKISDLTGREKLARPIMSKDYKELLSKGTVLKPEYIRLIEVLGFSEVFVEDSKLSPEEVVILRKEIGNLFTEKVRSIMERHIYADNKELFELKETAESIINSVLENDEIVDKIFDIKERSADIYEHSISVCSLSVIVAAKLKLSEQEMKDLAIASLFHDIGLRCLDFNYTNRFLDELNENELREYRKHPVYSFSSLEHEPWISKDSKLMILQHHERVDGSGFPMHAKVACMGSQILEVTDAFDEMICGIGCVRSRVYEAVEFLKMCKSSQFCEMVVDTMLEFTAVYPAGTVVKLNTGEEAIVVRQNRQFPERPIVKIIKDAGGNLIESEKICDLLEIRTVYIENVDPEW